LFVLNSLITAQLSTRASEHDKAEHAAVRENVSDNGVGLLVRRAGLRHDIENLCNQSHRRVPTHRKK